MIRQHRRIALFVALDPILIGAALLVVAWISSSPSLARSGEVVVAAGSAVVAFVAWRGWLDVIGRAGLLLAIVVSLQTVQFSHRLVQLVDTSRANRPFVEANGAIRQLNPAWSTMLLSWLAVAGLVAARRAGAPRKLVGLATLFTLLHSVDALYLTMQQVRLTVALDNYGLPRSPVADRLPGLIGRDGWLARHEAFRGALGPLASAGHLTVRAWWALGDVLLPSTALGVLLAHRGRRGGVGVEEFRPDVE